MALVNQSTYIRMGDTTNKVQFNTPSTGMMQRSHPKSKFLRFQKGSNMEKWIFPEDGKDSYIQKRGKWIEPIYKDRFNAPGSYEIIEIPIEVLQILIFGDNYYLVEYVKIEDLKEE